MPTLFWASQVSAEDSGCKIDTRNVICVWFSIRNFVCHQLWLPKMCKTLDTDSCKLLHLTDCTFGYKRIWPNA